MTKNLKEMQAEVREVNEANGWFESDRTVGDDVALLHSEVSEMFEAYRDHGLADYTTIAIYASTRSSWRPGTQAAMERIRENSERNQEHFEEGLRKAPQRPPYQEPLVFTDEELFDMAADGLGKPEGFGSEAADVLIRLLDTCERRGVDLVAEFERKLAYNRTRGHRHGGKLV